MNRLFDIIQTHLPNVHCLVDDTQLYLSFCPSDAINQLSAINALESCINDICSQMLINSPQLNYDNSKFLMIAIPQHLAKINIRIIRVGYCNVSTVCSARKPGSWFDSMLLMSMLTLQNCLVLPFIISRLLYMCLSLVGLTIGTCFCMVFLIAGEP